MYRAHYGAIHCNMLRISASAGSLAACATGFAADPPIQDMPAPYSMDTAWLAELSAASPLVGGRRSMGTNSGACNVRLVGTGSMFGVASCSISCTGSVTVGDIP